MAASLMNDLAQRRVTIMGLGRHGGGVGAARWLARQGARVTVTDAAGPTVLAQSMAQLTHDQIERYRLGGHVEADFREADVVVVNPAVKPDNRLIELARRSGAQITSEIELFLQACPAKMIGVTGSNGKSTTAAMIADIIRRDGRRVWLGGNIGGSLLSRLDEISPDDWVVLELSSFQLHHLSPGVRLPHVAVVTNFAANHQDWHGSLAHYRKAKQRLLTGQTGADLAVLNPAAGELRSWRPLVSGTLLATPDASSLPPLRVRGRHNRANAANAAAAAAGARCSAAAIADGLAQFRGLPHRLQFVAEIQGRRFFDDSSATTPESTIAALDAFDGPVWLLAGGYDKGCRMDPLAAAIAGRSAGAVFYGAARQALYRKTRDQRGSAVLHLVESLEEATQWCWRQSNSGDAVVLSPALASFDQFPDYRVRGDRFQQAVEQLPRPARSRAGA